MFSCVVGFADPGFAEAYRMNRRISDDPMANYVDKEL